ncbi:MAG: hypothetical protein A2201_03515 [Alicyclobacillus sp. RIFOXYA1_FULL_53_8]|nr:MAG: hypothetical protein A2201_03515 [Alicyclobacillus sp. RIFOXYA1_FULL_53_8]
MYRRAVAFLAFSHFVNDFLNGVIGAILPLLAVHFKLNYMQVGTLMMVANVSSSLIQPVFGYLSDKKGSAWVLPFGAMALGVGLVWLPYTSSFLWLLVAVTVSGMGSAAFHPDASRAVYFAAAHQRGLAQSIFQIGGNSGIAMSALSLWFLGRVGLPGTIWFMIPAVISTLLMSTLVRWFSTKLGEHRHQAKHRGVSDGPVSHFGLALLVFIVTVRSWVIIGITTFVPLLVVRTYGVQPKNVWMYTFVFLLLGAVGTMVGGPLADRIGQRNLIRMSMLASIPFALALPFLSQIWLLPDLGVLGFFLLSTFAVTVVYGQEMLPGNIAMVSGLLIGFAGGIGGIVIMLMGYLADTYSLHTALVWIVATVPVAAVFTWKLPLDKIRLQKKRQAKSSSVAAGEAS